MKTLFRKFGLTASAAVLAMCAFPATHAQESYIEYLARMQADADEYYFFESDRKQIVDYKTERIVRICTGESRHLVPLKITFDEEGVAFVHSGDCIRVEAKEIFLEPDEALSANDVIKAEVSTL